MGGKCIPQTLAMEDFMMEEVAELGALDWGNKWFLHRVVVTFISRPF